MMSRFLRMLEEVLTSSVMSEERKRKEGFFSVGSGLDL